MGKRPDVFEGAPAPSADELEEFDRIVQNESVRTRPDSTFHNQALLIIPRLTKEIRRHRELEKLELEAQALRDEREETRRLRNRQWDQYTAGLERLVSLRGTKREDVH